MQPSVRYRFLLLENALGELNWSRVHIIRTHWLYSQSSWTKLHICSASINCFCKAEHYICLGLNVKTYLISTPKLIVVLPLRRMINYLGRSIRNYLRKIWKTGSDLECDKVTRIFLSNVLIIKLKVFLYFSLL